MMPNADKLNPQQRNSSFAYCLFMMLQYVVREKPCHYWLTSYLITHLIVLIISLAWWPQLPVSARLVSQLAASSPSPSSWRPSACQPTTCPSCWLLTGLCEYIACELTDRTHKHKHRWPHVIMNAHSAPKKKKDQWFSYWWGESLKHKEKFREKI